MPVNAGAQQAAIAIHKTAVDASGKATLEVEFRPGTQPIAGLQFDVSDNEATLGLSIALGEAAAKADKSVYTSDSQPGTPRRVLIVGFNANAIGPGVVAMIAVPLRPETAPGIYPVVIDGVVAAGVNGDAVPLSADSGAVVVAGDGVEVPSIAAVVNAASYAAGSISAGELVMIAGSGLAGMDATLADTVVRFDGIPATLIYTSPNQVSAVVPYAMDGRTEVSVDVEQGGIRSAPLRVTVSSSTPGIFTTTVTGQGQGAIVNQDGSVNGPGNPAPPGSVISIFATGEGQTEPAGVDGFIVPADDLRHPLLPVTVSIGGEDAEVIYAGSAPSQVSGVLQVNARVPGGMPASDAVPITIRIRAASQPGVTLAVR